MINPCLDLAAIPPQQDFSTLPLVLVAFSLNGTFLGLTEELTQRLFLCQERSSISEAAWRVGVEYRGMVSGANTQTLAACLLTVIERAA